MERPLKLNFQVSSGRLERLEEQKAFSRLEDARKAEIVTALRAMGTGVFMNRDAFSHALSHALKTNSVKVGAPVRKAVLAALSNRDEEADACNSKAGNPEPDTTLRDHERVPLTEDWRDYFKREVEPFVADAWVDENYKDSSDKQVGRVGYEINFNRYFYKYVPPRPLKEINAELRDLEDEIAGLLKDVLDD